MILNPISSQALSLHLHLTRPKRLEKMKDVDESFAQAPASGEPIALSLRLLSPLRQSLRAH